MIDISSLFRILLLDLTYFWNNFFFFSFFSGGGEVVFKPDFIQLHTTRYVDLDILSRSTAFQQINFHSKSSCGELINFGIWCKIPIDGFDTSIYIYTFTVKGVSWISTYMFLASYFPHGSPDDQPTVVLTSGSVSTYIVHVQYKCILIEAKGTVERDISKFY